PSYQSSLPPHTLPPSPSTTLFRSQFQSFNKTLLKNVKTPARHRSSNRNSSSRQPVQSCTTCLSFVHTYLSLIKRAEYNFTIITQDRKSTRLNSSHISNSYAVCCL